MDSNQANEHINDIQFLLNAGKLNDAFALASQHLSFCTDNEIFLGILGESLKQLGFTGESNGINEYLKKLKRHHDSNYQQILNNRELSKSHGPSAEYNIDGVSEEWKHPAWEHRAKLVASMIPENASVLDLGCGGMLLEQFLHKPKIYLPCDLRPRDDRTIVCDFDKLQYPEVSNIDYLTCLGVLNYLEHQKELLQFICSQKANFYIVLKPRERILKKIENGLFPDAVSIAECESILSQHGHQCAFKYFLGQGEEVLIKGLLPS